MNKIFFKRHLPHLHFNDGIYFITSRLYDPSNFYSLMASGNNETDSKDEFNSHFEEYDNYLHKMKSSIHYFDDFSVASILKNEFHNFDNREYELIAYTIMSNHFHLLFKLLSRNSGISKILQKIKGRSAFLINKYLNRKGKLWQDESYDRWVRDDKELYFIIKYILENPVKAGLVKTWNDYPFSYCKEEYLVL